MKYDPLGYKPRGLYFCFESRDSLTYRNFTNEFLYVNYDVKLKTKIDKYSELLYTNINSSIEVIFKDLGK